MNEEELQELYRRANRALNAGRDPEAVNEAIRARTNGEVATHSALSVRLASVRDERIASERQQRADNRSRRAGAPDSRGGDVSNPTSGQDPRFTPANDHESQDAHDRDWSFSEQLDEAKNTLRMVFHGMTFGLSDELHGLASGGYLAPNIGDLRSFDERQRDVLAGTAQARGQIGSLRRQHPFASVAAEAAGGALLPGAGWLRAGGGAALAVGRPMAAAGRAILPGAAAGGLLGFGEAEGSFTERLPEMLAGAGTGAVVAPVLAAGGTALGRTARALARPRTGADIAETLAQRTGVAGGEIEGAVQSARAQVQRVSDEAFKPLDEQFRAISDPPTLEALSRPDVLPAVREVMGRDVGSLLPARGSRRAATVRLAEEARQAGRTTGRLPSFGEIQAVRRRLQDDVRRARRDGDRLAAERFSNALSELDETLNARIPGFSSANATFRTAKSAESAFEQGAKAWGFGSKTQRPEQIRSRLDALPTDEARSNFRAGMVASFHDHLMQQGRVTREMIDGLQAAGVKARIRELFNSATDFNAFMDEIERTGHAVVDRHRLASGGATAAKWIAAGLAAGAGIRASRGLFDE